MSSYVSLIVNAGNQELQQNQKPPVREICHLVLY